MTTVVASSGGGLRRWGRRQFHGPDFTFNPWLGCVEVSPACDNCYARTLVTGRLGRDVWGKDKPRPETADGYWRQPFRWNRQAEQAGERRRVFCGSLCDVMEDAPGRDLDRIRGDLYKLIRVDAVARLAATHEASPEFSAVPACGVAELTTTKCVGHDDGRESSVPSGAPSHFVKRHSRFEASAPSRCWLTSRAST